MSPALGNFRVADFSRVLAGPFKTDEEARVFVNKLKARGLSGFTFTSPAGQVVRKLDDE